MGPVKVSSVRPYSLTVDLGAFLRVGYSGSLWVGPTGPVSSTSETDFSSSVHHLDYDDIH